MTRQSHHPVVRIGNWVLAAIFVAMVVMVFTNVVLRYVFHAGIVESEELSRLLFVWLTFIGAVLVTIERGHQAIDILLRRLGTRARQHCERLAEALCAACSLALAIGCYQQTLLNHDNVSPVTGVPIAYFYLAGLISGAGMAIVLAIRLIKSFGNRGRGEKHA